MKTSDYFTVGFIAIFVTIISYFLVNSILGDPSEATVRFEYLDSVSTEIVEPDSEVFNMGAINPTVEVYVGSCVDLNQNGILDDDEKRACGQDAMETNTGETTTDYLQQNGGLSNAENDTINAEQGYASGTSAEQRQAVEDDVSQYQQQQQAANAQSQQQSAASRTTVSGE